MEVTIKTLPEFDRRAKRLSKKYRSFKDDLLRFVQTLQNHPTQGNNLGGGVYKVRIAIASKDGGKSGGGRVITYAVKVAEPDIYEVTLLSVYDKSEVSSVTDGYIKELVKQINP